MSMIANGFHTSIPFADYLALERLSPSGAKLLARSPAHYAWSRAHPYPETPALRIGKATHSLALEGREAFAAAFAVAPECDRRTTVGKALWADFTAASLLNVHTRNIASCFGWDDARVAIAF